MTYEFVTMLYICSITVFIFINIICDFSYFIRTLFTVLSGRIYQNKRSINDVTTIYGLCTLQDCDVYFSNIRLARLIRELDFARYHFYDSTGIYCRSRQLHIKSLQGCTLTVTTEPVPLFHAYKINTKLVYWDDRSLFLEHEVVTLSDGKVRHFLVSRQHAIGDHGHSTEALLEGLQGSETKPSCPEYIQIWLQSMHKSSFKLRKRQL